MSQPELPCGIDLDGLWLTFNEEKTEEEEVDETAPNLTINRTCDISEEVGELSDNLESSLNEASFMTTPAKFDLHNIDSELEVVGSDVENSEGNRAVAVTGVDLEEVIEYADHTPQRSDTDEVDDADDKEVLSVPSPPPVEQISFLSFLLPAVSSVLNQALEAAKQGSGELERSDFLQMLKEATETLCDIQGDISSAISQSHAFALCQDIERTAHNKGDVRSLSEDIPKGKKGQKKNRQGTPSINKFKLKEQTSTSSNVSQMDLKERLQRAEHNRAMHLESKVAHARKIDERVKQVRQKASQFNATRKAKVDKLVERQDEAWERRGIMVEKRARKAQEMNEKAEDIHFLNKALEKNNQMELLQSIEAGIINAEERRKLQLQSITSRSSPSQSVQNALTKRSLLLERHSTKISSKIAEKMNISERNRSQIIEQRKEKAMNSLKRVEIAKERRKTEREKLAEAIEKIKPLSIVGVNRIQEVSKASAEKALNALKESLLPGASLAQAQTQAHATTPTSASTSAPTLTTTATEEAQSTPVEWVNIQDYNLQGDPTSTLAENRVIHNLLNANITNQVLVKLLTPVPEMDVFLLIMLRLLLPQQRASTFSQIKHMLPHLKRVIIAQLSNGNNIRLCLLLSHVAKLRIEPDFLLDCIANDEMSNGLVYKLILSNAESLSRGVEEECVERLAHSAVEIRRKDIMEDFLLLLEKVYSAKLNVPIDEVFKGMLPYMLFDVKISNMLCELFKKATNTQRNSIRGCFAQELYSTFARDMTPR